jgi:hypothetical protein|tara:strand:- start:9292 stop:9597 length:306 start_codon:yes stop_codon:yes gene_type:complete
MKTFEDLNFNTHKNTKKGISATMELTPNVFMSVIAGPGFYSTPGGIGSDDSKFKNKPSVKDFSSFEVGIIDENLPEDEQQFEVTGWMGRDEINTLISKHGK